MYQFFITIILVDQDVTVGTIFIQGKHNFSHYH